jgi:hypothetical protein
MKFFSSGKKIEIADESLSNVCFKQYIPINVTYILFHDTKPQTLYLYTKSLFGRTIAQAVSRWLPTAAARVRARLWSSWICGGQSGAGSGFLRVLRFPLPILISPNSSLS